MPADIWKLSGANIIIFSLNHYCILNICSFLFLPFKGSQEFAFRRVQHTQSIHKSLFLSIYVIFLEWDFNRPIENLWYKDLQQV